MKNTDKYESYCQLVLELAEKQSAINGITQTKGKLEFEVSSIKNKIKEMSEDGLSFKDINKAKRMQFDSCMESTLIMSSGGSLSESPLADFKRSEAFKGFSKKEKQIFSLIKGELMDKQYNIQSAMIIAEDEPSFDVSSSPIVSDYISTTVENLEGYNDMPADKVKKIKEIMYIFVEHVSI
tara:strand:- start:2247 stop:2789 length:543 start_codon:yes stop_codon:yes gene_type:complete